MTIVYSTALYYHCHYHCHTIYVTLSMSTNGPYNSFQWFLEWPDAISFNAFYNSHTIFSMDFQCFYNIYYFEQHPIYNMYSFQVPLTLLTEFLHASKTSWELKSTSYMFFKKSKPKNSTSLSCMLKIILLRASTTQFEYPLMCFNKKVKHVTSPPT